MKLNWLAEREHFRKSTSSNQTELIHTKPNSSIPNWTQLHQTKLIHTKPNSSTPNQTHPYQTELNHTKPNSSKPNQTKPDNSQPKLAGYAWQNHIQLWLVTCYSVHSCHFTKSWVTHLVTFVFRGLADRSSASQKCTDLYFFLFRLIIRFWETNYKVCCFYSKRKHLCNLFCDHKYWKANM